MEKKKSKIIEGLEKYLRETHEEQLKKDWEELEKYNQFGPDMEECLSRARARILDNMREESRALQIEEAAKAVIGDDAKLIEVFRDRRREHNDFSLLLVHWVDGDGRIEQSNQGEMLPNVSEDIRRPLPQSVH